MDNEFASISTLLMSAMGALSKRTRARLAAAGIDITTDQFALLDLLSRHDGQLTQSELADMRDKDKSVLMRQTDHFEALGLVTRSVSSEDRRKKTLMLTPQGKRLHAEAKALIDDLMRELLRDVPPQKLQGFLKTLAEIREKAQQS